MYYYYYLYQLGTGGDTRKTQPVRGVTYYIHKQILHDTELTKLYTESRS